MATRADWSLDPEITFLNHGSFGPTPNVVQQARQRYLEAYSANPMQFLVRDLEPRLHAVTQKLAEFIGTKAERVVLTDNATYGMNVVADSLDLQPDDEVLLTNHEYGAVQRIWQIRTRKAGAHMRTAILPDPLTTPQAIVESIEAAITPKTRIVIISHITSPTAVRFPIAEIAKLCRHKQVLCCIDGPHGFLMDDLKLDDIGCDFYTASCHKWLCAPAGTGFFYVHTKHWGMVKPLLISWGRTSRDHQPRWQDNHNWLGTNDYSKQFAIADALDFMIEHGLTEFREHTHQLVGEAVDRLSKLFGSSPLFDPDSSTLSQWFGGLVALRLPASAPVHLPKGGQLHPWQIQLVNDHRVETLFTQWNQQSLLRLSFHWYNTSADLDRLEAALKKILS